MREAYIRRQALRRGLDPQAVLRVASAEGLSGGIGDGGHAFGPFQLNDAGGVLTNHPASHHSNQWAWSNQGINYALDHIAQVARGMHGAQAVRAIVTRFERPADPQGEIARALAAHVPGGSGGAMAGLGQEHGPKVAQNGARQQLVSTLLAQNQQFYQTGKIDPLLTQSAMQNGLTHADQQSLGNHPAPHGMALSGSIGKAIRVAQKQIGTPYVWGGAKPGGFDCSGLIQYAYAKAGVALPRTTYDMIKRGAPVQWGQFRPGDLVFTNGGDHVVMYIGNGKAISAPHTGAKVHQFNINDVRGDFYAARRIAH